ncbi:LysR substrate binding domain protein [compost metagenome]
MPEMNYVSDNISVVGAMVAAGVGIAAVPQLALRLMDATRLCSLELHSPIASREIGILLKKQRSLSAAALHFLDTLRRTDPG